MSTWSHRIIGTISYKLIWTFLHLKNKDEQKSGTNHSDGEEKEKSGKFPVPGVEADSGVWSN